MVPFLMVVHSEYVLREKANTIYTSFVLLYLLLIINIKKYGKRETLA